MKKVYVSLSQSDLEDLLHGEVFKWALTTEDEDEAERITLNVTILNEDYVP